MVVVEAVVGLVIVQGLYLLQNLPNERVNPQTDIYDRKRRKSGIHVCTVHVVSGPRHALNLRIWPASQTNCEPLI